MPDTGYFFFENALTLAREKADEPFLKNAATLLNRWYAGQEEFAFKTSGSTGAPKTIIHIRETLAWSARNSIKALGIKAQMPALLCLPAEMIAGSMLLIRAAIAEQRIGILKPTLNPAETLPDTHPFRSVSMVPTQIQSFFKNEKYLQKLHQFEIVLIGGGPMDWDLEQKIIAHAGKTRFVHSYGMTETASHIALREIYPQRSTYYRPLQGVELALNEAGCLQIKCPANNNVWFDTNDLANLQADGTFTILGRTDFAIISGGIKIIPEFIEQKIRASSLLRGVSFIIAGLPDEKLVQRAVLVHDAPSLPANFSIENLKAFLPKYQGPIQVIQVHALPYNSAGKIDRMAVQSIIKSQANG